MTIANDNLTEKPFSRLVPRFFARGRIILSVAAWSIVLRPDGSLVFERVVKRAFFIFMPEALIEEILTTFLEDKNYVSRNIRE